MGRHNKRASMTEEKYYGIKAIREALEKAGNAPNNTKLGELTGFSGTTIGRVLITEDYEAYKKFQNEVAHSQGSKNPPKEQELPLGEQPQPPAVDPVDMHLALIRRSLEMQDSMNASMLDHIGTMERIAERQAVALEQLVEAWNNTGKKGFLGR